MAGGITRMFNHRGAGAAWAVLSAVLAGTLAVTTVQANRKEDFLRARIAALATHDSAQLQAELVSCRATVHSYAAALSGTPRGDNSSAQAAPIQASDPSSAAAELVSTPPAGIDVCARMESADQAVLKALDRR